MQPGEHNWRGSGLVDLGRQQPGVGLGRPAQLGVRWQAYGPPGSGLAASYIFGCQGWVAKLRPPEDRYRRSDLYKKNSCYPLLTNPTYQFYFLLSLFATGYQLPATYLLRYLLLTFLLLTTSRPASYYRPPPTFDLSYEFLPSCCLPL